MENSSENPDCVWPVANLDRSINRAYVGNGRHRKIPLLCFSFIFLITRPPTPEAQHVLGSGR